jgi:CBS domain-containing protein
MKIADLMTRDVRVIQPDHTIRDAARLMDELDVGVLPVCDGRRLIGMITDRDITVRSTAAGQSPTDTQVSEVMTDELFWCFDDDDVEEIVDLMGRHQIRRIPVVDRRKRLVGIVALGDLATDDEPAAARALHRISEPSEPDRSGTPSQRRADQTRDRAPPPLTPEERRILAARLQRDDRAVGRSSLDDPNLGTVRFREDEVRAAFGIAGRPGEENMRNPRMPGGFGGDGYNNYGDDYGPGVYGGGAGYSRAGYSNARPGVAANQTGRPRRDRDLPGRNDRRNYGVGPGNTRFGNDATTSHGEVHRGEHSGRGPRNYQRSDDRILEDIHERLTEDPMLDASYIEVVVIQREVTLNGSVRDRNEKRRAEDAAESISGVTHVQNNLRVGQHLPEHSTGTGIGDSGAASGNPASIGGPAGTTAGSPSGGRATGERARRERART